MTMEPTQSPTIQQVVQTAYRHACGDLPADQTLTPDEYELPGKWLGDGLLEFLIREVEPDGTARESVDHWTDAVIRVAQAHREVTAVLEALRQHAPPEALAAGGAMRRVLLRRVPRWLVVLVTLATFVPTVLAGMWYALAFLDGTSNWAGCWCLVMAGTWSYLATAASIPEWT